MRTLTSTPARRSPTVAISSALELTPPYLHGQSRFSNGSWAKIPLMTSSRVAAASLYSFVHVLLGGFVTLSAATPDGVWRSQGYGYVFEFEGSKVRAFSVTDLTCVESFSAGKEARAASGIEATFRGPSGLVLSIRSGGSADHRTLHIDGSASDVRIDRVARKPATCDRPTADTPLGNFDVFAQTWAEHYISFDLKHVDWSQVVAENRAKITPTTSPVQLFDILRSMISPFGDAHTSIQAPKLKKSFSGIRSDSFRAVNELGGKDVFFRTGIKNVFDVTKRAYLTGPVRSFCNDQIQYGHVDAATGYLRIVSFDEYAKSFEKGQKALDSALDEMFSDQNLRRLVIDVRINFGGADPYGLAIASRLATVEYLAYTKYARAERDKWTQGDSSVVKPSTRPSFHGAVVLLTGPLTISAGESFTQALLGRVPHVTRIGENTQGVFSDVLIKSLPNGWVFGLPNEVYRTPNGDAFDGPGIPPEIPVTVFGASDVTAGRDAAMAAAKEVLLRESPLPDTR